VSSGGLAAAVITQVKAAKSACVELSDLGTTLHLSPHSNDFTMYCALEPLLFLNAANGQQFLAVGTGTIVISTPNGSGQTSPWRGSYMSHQLGTPSCHSGHSMPLVTTLKLVVAILRSTHPGGNTLHTSHVIHGVCTMHVPHKGEGMYAVEIVSVMELHQWMGHIAPASAHKLVEGGLVTGIALDPNLCKEHCEACIYAHATREPVPKLQVSKQAQEFGDEIHTNMWGPSPVAT
jgi:hypothetical protein